MLQPLLRLHRLRAAVEQPVGPTELDRVPEGDPGLFPIGRGNNNLPRRFILRPGQVRQRQRQRRY